MKTMNNQNNTNNIIKQYTVTQESSIKDISPEYIKDLNIIDQSGKKQEIMKQKPGLIRATQALKLANPFRGV